MLLYGDIPPESLERPGTLSTPNDQKHNFEANQVGTFYFELQPYEEVPLIRESSQFFTAIYGTPFYRNKRLSEIKNFSLFTKIISNSIGEIDSSFLIICLDKTIDKLTICTDRFGSRVFFYSIMKDFVAFSTAIHHIYRLLRNHKTLQVDKEAIFEFLWFRRLFGEKTYLKEIQILPAASVCSFEKGLLIGFERYWFPNPSNRSEKTTHQWAESLESSITRGVELAIEDEQRHLLMLSGGLDSRALLSVGANRYISVTNTPTVNQEYRIARETANLVHSKHHHIIRPKTYLENILEDAVLLSNGMTLYYECQFLGYQKKLAELGDDVQMGLFLDVFFCGHYMPKHHQRIGNRTSVYFVLDKIKKNGFEQYFLENISYRQKFTDLSKAIRPTTFRSGYDSILHQIRQITSQGQDYGFSDIELWEYLHLNNIGRHYSMLMAHSLRHTIDVRLPALTNENYDIAFSLPPLNKYNWSTYIDALKRIHPEIMNITNSNTNNPAKHGLHRQTYSKILKGLVNVVRPNSFSLSPNMSDRSWPLVRDSLTESSLITEHLNKMLESGRILDLQIIDRSKIKELFRLTQSGKEDHSVFLNQLLTIEKGLLALVM